MLAEIIMMVAAVAPQENSRVVYHNGRYTTYSSAAIARNVKRNLSKNAAYVDPNYSRTTQPVKAVLTAGDYTRNPALGLPPRVTDIEMNIVPAIVKSDITSGISLAQQRQVKNKLKSVMDRLPPLEKWQPSKVRRHK